MKKSNSLSGEMLVERSVDKADITPETILDIQNLQTVVRLKNRLTPIVRGVSFSVYKGKMLGLVGETGSGKTMTAMGAVKLLTPPAYIVGGSCYFNGQDLLSMEPEPLRRIRGNNIGVIFQNPKSALHPLFPVGKQLINVYLAHQNTSRQTALQEAGSMLAKVQIADPSRIMNMYPHELSGGMSQRIMIAMALINSPSLVIADEPTTGLDVTIQLQILNLMRTLLQEQRSAGLVITHDLGLVAQFCTHIVVMYAGQIVEQGKVKKIFAQPTHPYTKRLLSSAQLNDYEPDQMRMPRGAIVDFRNLPRGCAYQTRCPFVFERCLEEEPPLYRIDQQDHLSRCFLSEQT